MDLLGEKIGYLLELFSKEKVQPEAENSTAWPLCPFPQCLRCQVASRCVAGADLHMIRMIVVLVKVIVEDDGYCCFSAPSKDP